MALHGNLHDFDISYIVQLIAQEGKTGNLVITSYNDEGYVVFKQGKIICTGTNRENIQTMLYRYAIITKRCASQEIEEVRILYHNNLRRLCQEYIEREYITPQELSIISETGIEDLACSIFGWKDGNYRFDTVPNVDTFQIGSFAISADAITMEAARRSDEWNRLHASFLKDTVFIQSETTTAPPYNAALMPPIDYFADYLLSRVDGISSVEFLCQQSFFSQYQVYQTLHELLEAKKIVPLPDTISHSINAALRRRADSTDFITSRVLVSAIITSTFIAIILLTGTFIIKGILFADMEKKRYNTKNELIRARSNQKIAIATLHYQTIHGEPPQCFSDLVLAGTISTRDLRRYFASSIRTHGKENLP